MRFLKIWGTLFLTSFLVGAGFLFGAFGVVPTLLGGLIITGVIAMIMEQGFSKEDEEKGRKKNE